jgi:hypothetical protein
VSARLIAKARQLAAEQAELGMRLNAEVRQMMCRPLSPLRRRLKARADLAVATADTLLALVAKLEQV